jgi:prepilin-type N-terminal cleavage/methylation domain-containing protein
MKKIPKYPKSKIPKKTNTTNESRIRNSPGFTLVEVLVAISILSIGILAVSQMTVMGMKVNTVVNQRMYAENLNTLPSNHAWLKDTDGTPNLTIPVDSSGADHYTRVTDPNAPYSFMTWWRVAELTPETGMKTIRIWVVWGQAMNHNISTDLIKRM